MNKKRAGADLIRYVYTKMQEKDPKGFINFVIGGMTEDGWIEEAQIISNDYEEHAYWVEDTPEFKKLLKEFRNAE